MTRTKSRRCYTKLQLPCRTHGGILLLFFLIGCVPPKSATQSRPSSEPLQVTSREKLVESTLERILRKRKLSTDVHGAWQVLHGILAYGNEFPLQTLSGVGPALPYLLTGGDLGGWTFVPGEKLANGRIGLRAVLEPGGYIGQGHADQWFAILAQCDLALEDTVTVQGKTYAMKDFLAQTQRDVSNNLEDEWSWTIIGLTHYLPTSTTWTANDGDMWSIDRLVSNEIRQSLEGSTCGGTHRLIGVSMALNKRKAEGAPITSTWRAADELISRAVATTKQYQNGDGSFSTNYFSRPGISSDSAKLLSTTGHTLEFLALTLSPDQLREPWVVRSVERLCQLLNDAEELPLECGALYHAAHGLAVYRDRTSES